jgi:virulence factor Mce-like protein
VEGLLEELCGGREAVRRLALVVVIAAAAFLTARLAYEAIFGAPGGPTWTAEFTDARGLVPGNDVRDDGAVVGRVVSLDVSHQGTALVRFQLYDQRAAPRTDAVAAIEPADLLGDNYLSLSPGRSSARLRGPITPAHTVNAPRLDQVLDTFQPNVRDGLQLLLLEGGLALDQRGGALARATVALRPTLAAADDVVRELDTQNGSLARLVGPAHELVAQLASRRADIGPLLDGLARTLQATAGAAAPLDRGLSGLPATLTRLRSTSSQLAALSGAATPLLTRLEGETGQIGQAARGLPRSVGYIRSAAPGFDGALDSARTTLAAGTPGLSQLAADLPTLRAQAPKISTLLGELDRAAPGIAQGFFVDFPDQADESGRQPFDPFADPRRAYWRGAAVFSCEAFGVPVKPGCLSWALANLAHQPPPKTGAARQLLDYLLRR